MVLIKLGMALCGLTELKPGRLVIEFAFWSFSFATLLWVGGERGYRLNCDSDPTPSSQNS